jgi:FixJ family two-component response regulator
MSRSLILILEDNEDRIRDFESAVISLKKDFSVRIWHDAPTMIAELPSVLNQACLISLDHGLNPQTNAAADPGTGLEVAEFLAECPPAWPVLIHSTNYERARSMHNELRFGSWQVDRVGPIGGDWIQCLWFPKVKSLLNILN